MKTLLHGVRDLGPYLLVELLLPGGSLIALLMWLFRRHSRKANPQVEKTQNLPAHPAAAAAPAPRLGVRHTGGLCPGGCA
jgi:hypothetical protein